MNKLKVGDNVFHDGGSSVYTITKIVNDRAHVKNKNDMHAGDANIRKFALATSKELVDNFNKECFRDMNHPF